MAASTFQEKNMKPSARNPIVGTAIVKASNIAIGK